MVENELQGPGFQGSKSNLREEGQQRADDQQALFPKIRPEIPENLSEASPVLVERSRMFHEAAPIAGTKLYSGAIPASWMTRCTVVSHVCARRTLARAASPSRSRKAG